MPSNNQKTPVVDGLNRFVSGKVKDIQALTGKALPATILAIDPSLTIVTVNFEVKTDLQIPIIQCPIGLPEFLRVPFKKGTKGFVMSVDAYMGGMSGLGGGTATLDRLPNLSTLVWFPCGNITFDAVDDPKKSTLYGDDGVILRDTDNIIRFELDKNKGLQLTWNGKALMTFASNGIAFQYQNNSIAVTAAGVTIESQSGNTMISSPGGNTSIDNKPFLPHSHGGVASGSNDTGGVT